jgi:hypothetical protein
MRLYHLRPRVIRLGAGYWGLRLIAWIHSALRAVISFVRATRVLAHTWEDFAL